MDIRKILISLLLVLAIGCSAATKEAKKAAVKPDFAKAKPVKLLPPPPPVVKAEVIEEDPLQDVYVTLDAVETSLSSILYMIAAESGLNLVISPDINITKPFTLTVNKMPARDALDIISESTGLHYSVKGNSLKILSTVTKTFKFPYVRMKTTQASQIGGDVFGSSEANLKGDYSLKYDNDPTSNDVLNQIIESIHAIVFPDRMDNGSETAAGAGESGASASGPQTGNTGNSTTSSGFFRGSEGYIYNKFTSILKVTTSTKKMAMVESYMKDVLAELNKQVLIEAKLVEVVLNDNAAYGINWAGALDGSRGSLSLGTAGGIKTLGAGLSPVGIIASGSSQSWFSFMASHGKVESMGNPRIRVMNGQSAMISSGQLIPYWEMDRETDTETNETTINYTRVTVLDGVVMGVTPHVKEDGTITLNIVPVFSDVESVKTQYNDLGEIVASYPIINLKEAGTVLNVKSGNTIIMGGLISNVETEVEDKVPFFGDIPLLGYLFKGKAKTVEKRELVIFLTTTIIDGNI